MIINNGFFLNYSAITKILGDWWANIDTFEKFGFTNLAKQVKLIKMGK